MAIVWTSAGWTKWQIPAWHDGSALAAILADDFRVTALGQRVAGWTGLVSRVGRTIPWIEMLAPVAIVLSAGRLRTAAIATLGALALAFGLCLEVGLFPWVAAVGLVALLPAAVWGGEPVAAAPPAPRAAVGQVLAGVILAWVAWWSVEVARSPVFRAPPRVAWVGDALFLQQDWRMFSEPPARTGWIVVPGRLRDGTEIDLFAAGGRVPRGPSPVRWERPPVPSRTFANDRWRLLLARGVYATRDDRRLLNWGRYLCREWNASHAGGAQLQGFEVVFVQRALDGRGADYARQIVWTHRCFG
jgi:hypothetical protein